MTRQGNAQVADAGSAVPTAPSVVVVDANGLKVPGVTVNFSVTSGGGTLATATTQTDKSGVASTGGWTLGTTAGLQTMIASVPNAAVGAVVFSATARPGPTASLTKLVNEPSSSPAGGDVDLAVRAADQFGNPVQDQAVKFTVTAGGGTVSPTSPVTLSDGRAVSRWTLGPDVGATNTATASRPDGSLAVTFSTTATKAVAAVRFAQHVFLVDSGSNMTPAVTAFDASGTAMPGAGVTLTARNTTVASAGASLTGLKSGQTFVVASSVDNASAVDSAILIVSGVGKPAVSLNVPRFDLKTDTTFTVSLVLDSRSTSTAVGSATLQVVWNTSVLSFVSEQSVTVPNALIDVNTSSTSAGMMTIGLASSAGIAGAVELRRITFKASSSVGRSGTLSVDVVDISAATSFANLAGQTVSGFYPLRIR